MQKRALIYIVLGIGILFQTLSSQTWSETKRLTWMAGGSFSPSIASDSNNDVCVVWTDYETGNAEIYFKKSANGGTSWTHKRHTWNSGQSGWPAMAINASNNFQIIYSDDSPGNVELYHKKGIQ